jgi:hypothetical protein
MWEWSNQLKLGKSSSAFVKTKLRALPLTEVQFEADFFLDPGSSIKREEQWMGLVVDFEFGAILAMEVAHLSPPTVNDLANLLAHAMVRPLTEGTQQRPKTIHLRSRAQWQELLPHLRQLGISIAFDDNLSQFDDAVIDWIQRKKNRRPSTEETRENLRKPFPEKAPICLIDAVSLMEWTDRMSKESYPSRKVKIPTYSGNNLGGWGHTMGGLVGHNGGEISNCYSSVSLVQNPEKEYSDNGGLIGVNEGSVSYCYSTGEVSGANHMSGGLVGDSYYEKKPTIHSFWDLNTSGQTTSGGGIGKTTLEMQTASTFLETGWDFIDETNNGTEDIWWIDEGQDYPRLWWELTPEN